jgi:Uma2 family endonuclease
MPIAAAEPMDAEEFLALPESDAYELIDGELRERCMGLESVWVAGAVHAALYNFNASADAGTVFPDGAALRIFADRPRYIPRPDGVFISHARFNLAQLPQSSVDVPPELAVEVVSIHDGAGEVERKVRAYLNAGVDVVWVFYPRERTIHVYRRAGPPEVLLDGDVLRGEGPLAGLAIEVTSLFPKPVD